MTPRPSAMTLIARGLGYTYAGGARVGPLDLGIGPGERVLLSGPSGSGKTTVLRLLSGIAARTGWGTVSGAVEVGGADPGALPPAERPRRLGFVAQDPKDQLVCGTVADELGFGPECAGMDPEEVERRIGHQASRAGLGALLLRDPHGLSAGEQQRLVTGAALAAGARVLLLDEPLAHLDPAGADALLEHLRVLSEDGITVVLAEHRLRKVAPWATRQVGLEAGRIVWDGPPRAPAAAVSPPRRSAGDRAGGPVVAEARGISHAWGDRIVLDQVDLVLRAGERVALLGANGIGKSTLLGRLSGRLSRPLSRPPPGRLGSGPSPGTGGAWAVGSGGWSDVIEVPQDPDLTLFCASVTAELAYGPRDRRLPAGEVARRVEGVARGLGLAELLDQPPHGLSRGQRLRVAVGAALTCRPQVLLLDEPTSGQDPEAVERVMGSVEDQLGAGALLFATHDEDLARRWAHRVLRLEGGRLREEGA